LQYLTKTTTPRHTKKLSICLNSRPLRHGYAQRNRRHLSSQQAHAHKNTSKTRAGGLPQSHNFFRCGLIIIYYNYYV
jgi:hypothetical protein